MPFIKMASFSLFTIPLPSDTIMKLDAYLKSGKFPQVNIKLYIEVMTETKQMSHGCGVGS
jgi:hypothetical protein